MMPFTESEPLETVTRASCAAIVVAGGQGRRFGGLKQYRDLGGKRVIDFSLASARAACALVVLVVPEDLVGVSEPAVDAIVPGGATRSESVRAGLAAIPADHDVIVVHDAVRPLANATLFGRVIDAVRDGADAAVPGLAVVDTLRRVDGRPLGVGRDELVAVQTPQAFTASMLRRVHADHAADATDDASLVSAAGGTVTIVPGARTNLKITESVDLVMAEALLATSTPGDARREATT